jgi:hypothetical protein
MYVAARALAKVLAKNDETKSMYVAIPVVVPPACPYPDLIGYRSSGNLISNGRRS